MDVASDDLVKIQGKSVVSGDVEMKSPSDEKGMIFKGDLNVFEWKAGNGDEDGDMAATDKSTGNANTSEGMYQPGSKLEALDIATNKWYDVKVVEVDWDEREVLIHFEKWSQRFDEWIPMDSWRLRTALREETQNENMSAFQVGETVMATWSDGRKYPAKVKAVLSGDNFEVLFFDGFTKTMKIHKLAKCSGTQGIEPVLPRSPPITMSKLERRERKRKIQSVAELFHFKRTKRRSVPTPEEPAVIKPPVVEPAKTAKVIKDSSLQEKKKSHYTDLTASDNEGEKTYINLDTSFTQDESNTDKTPKPKNKKTENSGRSRNKSKAAAAAVVEEVLPVKRKRSYNKVFLDNSTKSAPFIRGKKYGEGVPVSEYDNWEPEGEDAYVVETSDGLRRSIVVDDDRLPTGWAKHTIQRKSGNSAGKWDVFLVSPTGRRFRSRKEMVAYFQDTGEEYQPELFDFTLRGLSKRHVCNMRLKSKETEHLKPTQSSFQKKLGRAKVTPSQGSPEVSTDHETSPETQQRRVKTLLPKALSMQKGEGQSSPPPPHNPCTTQVSPTGQVTPVAVPVETNSTPYLVGLPPAQSDSSGFICPKDGCQKRFRKENLLQMHMKHYHPEYSQFMGNTPNVADLAYARTVREPGDELVSSGSFLEKINRFEATKKAKLDAAMSPPPPVSDLASDKKRPEKKEAETKRIGKTMPIEPTTPPSATHVGANSPCTQLSTPLRDLLRKEPISAVRDLPMGGTRDVPKVGVTAGIKTLLPIVRTTMKIPSKDLPASDHFSSCLDTSLTSSEGKTKRKRRLSDNSYKKKRGVKHNIPDDSLDQIPSSSDEGGLSVSFLTPTTRHQAYKKKKTPLLVASLMAAPKSDAGSETPDSLISPSPVPELTEEQLNKRDIINCTCGVMEEDGLMIQCDLCLCWQHGYCNSIEKESEVPDKYVCYICQHPMRERKSMHYMHNQDWLKEGTLPSLTQRTKDVALIAKRTEVLRKSHDLSAMMLEIQTVVKGLRVKVNIAKAPDHPKLYLWSKPWEKETFDDQPPSDRLVKTDPSLLNNLPPADSSPTDISVKMEVDKMSTEEVGQAGSGMQMKVEGAGEVLSDKQTVPEGAAIGEVPPGGEPGAVEGAVAGSGTEGMVVAEGATQVAADGGVDQAAEDVVPSTEKDANVGQASPTPLHSQILLQALTQGSPNSLPIEPPFLSTRAVMEPPPLSTSAAMEPPPLSTSAAMEPPSLSTSTAMEPSPLSTSAAMEPPPLSISAAMEQPSLSTSTAMELPHLSTSAIMEPPPLSISTAMELPPLSNSLPIEQPPLSNDLNTSIINDLSGSNHLDSAAQNQLLQFPICQSELMRFAHSMADNLKVAVVEPSKLQTPQSAPVPEKPIEPVECRLLLLDHIQHHQQLLMDRLQLIETKITALEAEDPEPLTDETLDFLPHTKQTIKMLLRDLTVMRNIAAIN